MYFSKLLLFIFKSLVSNKRFRNEHVLKDALTLIRGMDSMQPGPNLRVTTFDVTALYPSIDFEWGHNSLRWFLNTFCSEYQDTDLKDLIIVLSRFVPRNQQQSLPPIKWNGNGHYFCGGVCEYSHDLY